MLHTAAADVGQKSTARVALSGYWRSQVVHIERQPHHRPRHGAQFAVTALMVAWAFISQFIQARFVLSDPASLFDDDVVEGRVVSVVHVGMVHRDGDDVKRLLAAVYSTLPPRVVISAFVFSTL